MSPLPMLLAELAVSVVASTVVLLVLSRPLVKVLMRICQNEDSANFWLSYTRLMLLIAPMLLVACVEFLSRFSEPMVCVRLALMAILGGLLLGLHIVGNGISQSIRPVSMEGGKP